MKLKILPLFVLLGLLLLTCISCMTPSVTKLRPVPGVIRYSMVNNALIDGDMVRAEEARKRVIDFEGNAYFPSDWDVAEEHYNAAEYYAAADAYEEIFRKTIPLYAQAKEDEILSKRSEIISSGFASSFPEYLRNADSKALAAQDQYIAGDYYEAKDTADDALNEYETLLVGARIFMARQEILERDFVSYDPESFDRAEEIAGAALSEYEAGNRERAAVLAEEALLHYNTVLSKAWLDFASERRASAARERELALAEKANIASRNLFNEAEAIFNRAEGDFRSGNYKNAAIIYEISEECFVNARSDTEERRQRALEAIRAAERKIEESSEAAIDAQRVIEGVQR